MKTVGEADAFIDALVASRIAEERRALQDLRAENEQLRLVVERYERVFYDAIHGRAEEQTDQEPAARCSTG